jgi:hypothetical protein
MLWNGMFDKKPALICRCTGVADVINAVNFARESGIPVTVRGGGHSPAGKSVIDDGLVIDLSAMKGVRVDPIARTARAEGGVLLGELDRETQTFGLATTAGTVSDTGIAGLTLGGGMGWLARKYGLTVDNLLSVDIVTADGQFRTASADQNPDLYWAVRGAGANFGVVTSFEYQLHQVGPIVLGGLVGYPISRAHEVARFYGEFSTGAPDELNTAMFLTHAPPAPFVPEELRGQPIIGIGVCYCGPIEGGEAVVRPLRESGPAFDVVGPMPYTAVQKLIEAGTPPGLRYYTKANYIGGVDDSLIDALLAQFESAPSPMTGIAVFQLGGAAGRVNPEDTAFYFRDAKYHLEIIGAWNDPADDGKNIEWARRCGSATEAFASGGVYVNSLGDEGQDRVRAAYGGNYDRLLALKRRYDPQNMFNSNQNIQP